jgi:hypothetical protein
MHSVAPILTEFWRCGASGTVLSGDDDAGGEIKYPSYLAKAELRVLLSRLQLSRL